MLTQPKHRIYQIDLFRFLAALSVVFYHYLFRGYSADNLSQLDFSDIGGVFKYGYLGVEMFFIISGFVITLSIKSKSITHFIISRISRLYPIYWLSVLFSFLVILWFGAPNFTVEVKQFLLNLTMFQNYLDIKNIDNVYWTLFIEMKFYVFVIGFYLILNMWKDIKLDHLIYSWLSLSVMYLFFSDLYLFKIINFFLILSWSSYFIAGIIFYQIYKGKLNLKYSTLLAVTFFISIFHAVSKTEAMELKYNTTFSPYVICSLIFSFYLLMLLVSCKKLNSINYKWLTKIGMLTYPLYLIHQNVGYIIFNNLYSYMNKYILVTLTIIAMILLSFVMSQFYEPRVSNYLKSRLRLLFNVAKK